MQNHNDSLPLKPPKEFEVKLLANPEDLRKLTGKDPMPSWVIGEKIAEAIERIKNLKLKI